MTPNSKVYFIHGTAIDSRVWSKTVISSISKVFAPKFEHILFDWSGANNSLARQNAAKQLIENIKQRIEYLKDDSLRSITFVGHSHGGTVLLIASNQLRELIGFETEINFLTINTPKIAGGYKLEDETINHYHVYCKTDMVVPRAGFNKTGVKNSGGESRNWLGKPVGGEYSRKKDMGSNIIGSTNWEFESARINLQYTDQYRFKGLNPRTHFVSHRGWLEKNVRQWVPALEQKIKNRNIEE